MSGRLSNAMGPSVKCASGFHRTSPWLPSSAALIPQSRCSRDGKKSVEPAARELRTNRGTNSAIRVGLILTRQVGWAALRTRPPEYRVPACGSRVVPIRRIGAPRLRCDHPLVTHRAWRPTATSGWRSARYVCPALGNLGVLSLIGQSPATNGITATKEFGTGAYLPDRRHEPDDATAVSTAVGSYVRGRKRRHVAVMDARGFSSSSSSDLTTISVSSMVTGLAMSWTVGQVASAAGIGLQSRP